jgi:hypothetical protein
LIAEIEVPIEKIVKRLRERHVNEAIIDRVVQLNPRPMLGDRLRGLHRKRTLRNSWDMNVVTRREFDRRWGDGACRRLKPFDFVKAGGKRRWISGSAYSDGPSP